MRSATALAPLFIALLALFNAPTAALAGDSPDPQTDAGHAADASHGGGHDEPADAHGASKPELLDWDFGSAFWSVIVFVILLAILRATAWKPILQGLEQREKFIHDSLASAKRDREESERLLAEHAAKLQKAREEATAIVEHGRRDAEEVRKRIHVEAKSEADAIVARAMKDIQVARDDAIKKLHDETIQLASSIASKVVRRELSSGDHQRLLDEALEELSGVEPR